MKDEESVCSLWSCEDKNARMSLQVSASLREMLPKIKLALSGRMLRCSAERSASLLFCAC